MPARRVLLTGATGFVGGHVARALCAAGWTVRAIARDPAARGAREIAGLPVEVIAGDLSSGSSAALAAAAEGCTAIVHAAGLVKAASLAAYREVNALGTERLLAAARQTAPGALFVLVSSQAAAGPAREGRPVAEGDPARPVSWYGLSKREGEEAVARLWTGPWIVLRPGIVYGPGDRGLLRLFASAARGLLPVPAGLARVQLISARRAAAGIAAAAERASLSGRTGFLCEPEAVSIGDLARMIARLAEPPARLLPVPDFVVRLAGTLETLREKVTGRSRPFNADKAREVLAGDWLCDPAPMLRDLDLPAASPLQDGLRETWDWYRERGWLPL